MPALRTRLLLSLVMLLTVPVCADDGAASIAAGGLVVMKREPRIVMAKELLEISAEKVAVDYDFRNDSDEDVTSEVAFPVPDYALGQGLGQQSFDDFQLWIDGAPARYLIEARAFLNDVEYTRLLTSMNVDIGSLGHAKDSESPDIQRLTTVQRNQLEKAGLTNHNGNVPQWGVKKKYYWQQTFPARKIVHIRHEYRPVLGSENSVAYGLAENPNIWAKKENDRMKKEIDSFCLDDRLRNTLQQIAYSRDRWASYEYVDFILTTANTWKTPIEDFTLIVERPHWKNNRGEDDLADYVSFCWDGKVTKTDADHFSAHTTNLIPTKELRVGFFSVERRRF